MRTREVRVGKVVFGGCRPAAYIGGPCVIESEALLRKVGLAIRKACAELKVPFLTLYAFSHENWKRPKQEVNRLMELLDQFLDAEFPTLLKEKIRFRAIGRLEALPKKIQAKIKRVEERTKDFMRLNLTIALNYGSRGEIVDAARDLIRKRFLGRPVVEKELDRIDEAEFASHLYTAGLPDPDMLIRTSGEMRLSNFLLWQCSYSEIYISKKYWPDFKREDLFEAVKEFGERERRFGAVTS